MSHRLPPERNPFHANTMAAAGWELRQAWLELVEVAFLEPILKPALRGVTAALRQIREKLEGRT